MLWSKDLLAYLKIRHTALMLAGPGLWLYFASITVVYRKSGRAYIAGQRSEPIANWYHFFSSSLADHRKGARIQESQVPRALT